MINKKLKIGSDFSGVGAFIQALKRLKIEFTEEFACDLDKHARRTYLENYGNEDDLKILEDSNVKMIDDVYHREYNSKTNKPTEKEWQSVRRVENECSSKFSFPFFWNVYQREIPKNPLDVYISTPPCQTFSLAGKRGGEDDDRGILFYNSHQFIKHNGPRFFIFENVKGLLSDDKKNDKDPIGRTFRKWLDYLGGKSINGNPILFPHQQSVPYHIYYQVLNAKELGVPQNRERVFIVGIRDDSDNDFVFPRKVPLKKKLVDVLETNVDEKYFLSQKAIEGILKSDFVSKKTIVQDKESYFSCILSRDYKDPKCVSVEVSREVRTEQAKAERRQTGKNSFRDKKIEFVDSETVSCIPTSPSKDHLLKIGTLRTHKDGEGFREIKDNVCPTIPARARECGSGQPVIKYKNPTAAEIRTDEGLRFFKENCFGTIRTTHNGGDKVVVYDEYIRRLTPRECFRLMDFDDSFSWSCSDTQAYKQAGNSIVVKCYELILKKLLKIK